MIVLDSCHGQNVYMPCKNTIYLTNLISFIILATVKTYNVLGYGIINGWCKGKG